MIRRNFCITAAQLARLLEESKRQGLPASEILRRLIDAGLPE